jgi:hypothetical protein
MLGVYANDGRFCTECGWPPSFKFDEVVEDWRGASFDLDCALRTSHSSGRAKQKTRDSF